MTQAEITSIIAQPSQDLLYTSALTATASYNIFNEVAGSTATDTINGTTGISYRSFYTQVIGTGIISSGNIIFEGSNDNTTFIPIDVELVTGTASTIVKAGTIAASTLSAASTFFHGRVEYRYIKCRISTALGGTAPFLQAITRFSVQTHNSDLFTGQYNTTAPVLNSGEKTPLQVDASGNLKVSATSPKDVFVTGASGFNLINTNVLQSTNTLTTAIDLTSTTYGGDGSTKYANSLRMQLVFSATPSGGVITFQGSNDNITFLTVPFYDTSLNSNTYFTAFGLGGSATNRFLNISTNYRYIKAVFTTALTGAIAQSFTTYSSALLDIIPASIKSSNTNATVSDSAMVVQESPNTLKDKSILVTSAATNLALNTNLFQTTVSATASTDTTTVAVGNTIRSFTTQIIPATGTVTAGAITFEGSNDNTTFFTLQNVIDEQTLTNVNSAYTLVASTTRYFSGSTDFKYVRARISTAVTGTTTGIQAITTFSPFTQTVKHNGQYNTTAPTLVNGQTTLLQTDASGNLKTLSNNAPVLVTDIASVAITTSTTTSAITPTSGNSYEVAIPVTVVSGTSPTMNVSIQESFDGGTNWVTVYTFNTITTTGTYYSPRLILSGTKLRYVQTISGTTPSFTRSIVRTQIDGITVTSQYNTTLPQLTTGQTTQLQSDVSGRLITKPENDSLIIGLSSASTNNLFDTTAAGNASDMSNIENGNVTSYKSVTFQLETTGTITAGAIMLEGSNDNLTFNHLPFYQVGSNCKFVAPIAVTFIGSNTTLTSGTITKRFAANANGYKYLRLRTSTALTGTTPTIQAYVTFNMNEINVGNAITSEYRNTALTNTVQTVKNASGCLFGYRFINSDASSSAYIKFFDTTSVVLGTSTPKFILAVPPNSVLEVENNGTILRYFSNDSIKIVAVLGITDGSITAPATSIYTEILYA